VGEAYERYVGRWSRRVAETFVPWLEVPAGVRWLDVGCGTGALTVTVLAAAVPAHVTGVPGQGWPPGVLKRTFSQVGGNARSQGDLLCSG